mmetsp:Transcript_4598/g.8142  ORF Transcript_4598/g.8142 Transcript_4598/m.8142 type:complete len:103 (-) Transcript_4598:15-323(-)
MRYTFKNCDSADTRVCKVLIEGSADVGLLSLSLPVLHQMTPAGVVQAGPQANEGADIGSALKETAYCTFGFSPDISSVFEFDVCSAKGFERLDPLLLRESWT